MNERCVALVPVVVDRDCDLLGGGGGGGGVWVVKCKIPIHFESFLFGCCRNYH